MDEQELIKKIRSDFARKGGLARSKGMTVEERRKIATKASKAAAKARTAKAKARKAASTKDGNSRKNSNKGRSD